MPQLSEADKQYVALEKQQDFCYMQFAIEGKGTQSVCEKIKNPYRRDSCLQLIALQVQLEDLESIQNTMVDALDRNVSGTGFSPYFLFFIFFINYATFHLGI